MFATIVHAPLSKVTVEVTRILAGQIMQFAAMAGSPLCLLCDGHSGFNVLFTLRYSIRWRGSLFEIRFRFAAIVRVFTFVKMLLLYVYGYDDEYPFSEIDEVGHLRFDPEAGGARTGWHNYATVFLCSDGGFWIFDLIFFISQLTCT